MHSIIFSPAFARAFFGHEKLKTPLSRILDDGRTRELGEDYVYHLRDKRVVFIPKGFESDFASIPRIFWRVLPPASGKYVLASIVHDWLVASNATSWGDAADIMFELMIENKVNYFKRNAIYFAVLLFGLFHKSDPRQERLKQMQLDNEEYQRLILDYVVL